MLKHEFNMNSFNIILW